MEQANRYIKGVLSGEVVACLYVKQAVQRHVNDLARPKFEYYFDEDEAAKAIMFCRICRHTSGDFGGKPFNLQDNQAFTLAMLFGWRRRSNHKRRFTQCYLEMARKNGKSEIAAVIELYCGFCEGEEGAQIYTAATTRDQAGMVFRAAVKMANYLRNDSQILRDSIRVMANSVVYKPTDSFIQKVSADAGTLDGLNPHCAVIDEYHAHPKQDVKGVMQTAMGSRSNPLLLIITTAGFNKDYPCFKVDRANAVRVLGGDGVQDNLFACIWTLDDGDDWQDESIWIKANPNLGSTPSIAYLRDQVIDAKNKGGAMLVEVLTKNFNMWVDAPEVWIPTEKIKSCMAPVDMGHFAGRRVFAAFDLAAKEDTCSLAFFSPATESAPAIAKVYIYLPEDTINARRDEVPLREWAKAGFLIKTSGNIADYEVMQAQFLEISKIANIELTAYDQWNAVSMSVWLASEGFEITECRQNFGNLSEPMKTLHADIVSTSIIIDQNPVLLWMFGNVVLDRDANDNIKPNKKRSASKIDGVTALNMAYYAYLTTLKEPPKTRSYYEDGGELVFL